MNKPRKRRIPNNVELIITVKAGRKLFVSRRKITNTQASAGIYPFGHGIFNAIANGTSQVFRSMDHYYGLVK